MKKPTCGIYLFTCRPTAQVYVGASVSVETRTLAHLSELRLKKHVNPTFQALFDTHGEQAFEISVVEKCEPTKEALIACEQKWMDHFGEKMINHHRISRHAGPICPIKKEAKRKQAQEDKEKRILKWELDRAKQAATKRNADAKAIITSLKKADYSKEALLDAVNEVYQAAS